MHRLVDRTLAAAVTVLLAMGAAAESTAASEREDEAIAADDLRFFEQRIRPVLAESCYECHSAGSSDVKGGLYLDTRSATRRGGESGPAVVPGEVGESLLLEAIAYHGDVKMPPDSKLDDQVIADFVAWVERGAPDPRDGDRPTPTPLGGTAKAEDLWSLTPLSSPAVPEFPAEAVGEGKGGPSNAIDHFVGERLAEAGLEFAPRAERRTLIRRAYFDLIGLPPTPEEVAAFVADDSPDAFERVVDRLLASPRFGERWGRHWLDVARFAESSGGSRSRIYPNAWRYRDYVIRAFNDDVPYDRFVQEQVAGDLLDWETEEQRRRQLVATGFLAVGPKNLDAQDKAQQRMDVVDEQLDAMGQSLMGMTFGCARCHDHMFDPVSIEDYTAMAGIFRSTRTLTPGNINGVVHVDVPAEPAVAEALAAHEAEAEALREELAAAQEEQRQLQRRFGVRPEEGPFPVDSLAGVVVDASEARLEGSWEQSTYTPQHVGTYYLHDGDTGKGEKSATFVPELARDGRYEVRVAYNHGASRAAEVPVTVQHAEGQSVVPMDQTTEPPIDGIFVTIGRFDFEQGQDGSVTLSNEGTAGFVIADAVQFLPVEDLAKADGPTELDESAEDELASAERRVQALSDELAALEDAAPKPPQAMAVYDHEPADAPIHIGGEARRLGKVVPRGFPEAIAVERAFTIPDDESGRLELARWLTQEDHPLTWRVMANRIWGHLVGRPIVGTPDNFGMRGEPPTHPQLLDHLAARFVEERGSIKSMIRYIMLSRTYQQSHVRSEEASDVDPENRLRWRADRRRLDAEAIRDAMLLVSGDLELTMYGDTLEGRTGGDDDYSPPSNRRSVYLAVFRTALPEFLEVFDVADPNLVVGRRNVSTVPTQSLYLLNSPFMQERAAALAERVMAQDGDKADRVAWLYKTLLGRPPREPEAALSRTVLSEAEHEREAWRQLSHALLASLEFRYVE